jgi:uncharacterized protein
MNTRNKAKPAREVDPRKLDVAAFARDAGSLQGQWPAAELLRLTDAAAPEAPAAGWPAVQWSARGELRTPRGSEPQIWLCLEASARTALTCQRCLRPVEEALHFERWFRFARDESEAASLDADSEDDVLALPRSLDLRELVEDELLLDLPLVPRHEICPEVLPMSAGDEAVDAGAEERPNPFAVLAALKKK